MIVFKSKYPALIRYLLPFTYFLFYQHGVMARPYSMMTLALILCAMFWEERNDKPQLFCSAMIFLCLTSAYGIIIAGGIAAVWTFELLREKRLFSDIPRCLSMFALLCIAVFLLYTLWPKPDTYATNAFDPITGKDFIRTLFYFFFFVPSEALFTSYMADGALRKFVPTVDRTILMIIFSILIWSIIIYTGRKKHKYLYFVIPYTLLGLFASAKYFSVHHIGIVFDLVLFFSWISVPEKVTFSFRERTVIGKASITLVLISISCSLFWTITCCATDIKMPYALGRDLAEYIKENNLEDKTWVTTWQQVRDHETGELKSENTHQFAQVAVETNAYFDKNLLGDNFGGCAYLDHRIPTQEEILADYKLLQSEHIDYMIGKIHSETWDILGLGNTYRMDRIITIDRIWKTHHLIADIFIIRNDG